MSESYSVVMTGKVADGQDLDQVKANVGKLFRIGEDQLKRMFSGKPVAVRKGISLDQADKICAALLKAGAEAKVRSENKLKSAAKPQSTKPSAVPQPVAEPEQSAPVAVAEAPAAPRTKPEAVKPAVAGDFTPDLECPRCGHEQAFTTQCGLCKMDLTLHIQRLRRREKARAVRREAASAAN